VTLVDLEFKLGNSVSVSGDTEDAFASGPTESEDTVCEEWEDDGDLQGVCPLL